MILHGNFFEIMWQWKKTKFKFFIWSLMELELKITCACHQAKISICCQTPQVLQLLQIFVQRGFSTCWIQICHQIYSLTTPATQALTTWPVRTGNYGVLVFLSIFLLDMTRMYNVIYNDNQGNHWLLPRKEC